VAGRKSLCDLHAEDTGTPGELTSESSQGGAKWTLRGELAAMRMRDKSAMCANNGAIALMI
jgi:hypothetical protein